MSTNPELVDDVEVRPLRHLTRRRTHAPTRHCIRYRDDSGRARWHRVYRGVGADVRTLFIRAGRERLALDPITEFEVEST
jgi:hypothetical protein